MVTKIDGNKHIILFTFGEFNEIKWESTREYRLLAMDAEKSPVDAEKSPVDAGGSNLGKEISQVPGP